MTSLGVGLMLVARKRVGIKSRMLVKEALNIDSYKGIVKLVKAVLLMTLCFEAGGAILSFCFQPGLRYGSCSGNQYIPFNCGI